MADDHVQPVGRLDAKFGAQRLQLAPGIVILVPCRVLDEAVGAELFAGKPQGDLVVDDRQVDGGGQPVLVETAVVGPSLDLRFEAGVPAANADGAGERVAALLRRLRAAQDLDLTQVPGAERTGARCLRRHVAGAIHIDVDDETAAGAGDASGLDTANGDAQAAHGFVDIRGPLEGVVDVRVRALVEFVAGKDGDAGLGFLQVALLELTGHGDGPELQRTAVLRDRPFQRHRIAAGDAVGQSGSREDQPKRLFGRVGALNALGPQCRGYVGRIEELQVGLLRKGEHGRLQVARGDRERARLGEVCLRDQDAAGFDARRRDGLNVGRRRMPVGGERAVRRREHERESGEGQSLPPQLAFGLVRRAPARAVPPRHQADPPSNKTGFGSVPNRQTRIVGWLDREREPTPDVWGLVFSSAGEDRPVGYRFRARKSVR